MSERLVITEEELENLILDTYIENPEAFERHLLKHQEVCQLSLGEGPIGYVQKTLSPSQRNDFQDHLAGCDFCICKVLRLYGGLHHAEIDKASIRTEIAEAIRGFESQSVEEPQDTDTTVAKVAEAARPVHGSPEESLWDRLKTRLTNLGVSTDVTCWLDSWSEAETRELGFAGVLSGEGSTSGSDVKEVAMESLCGDVATLKARVPWAGERLRIVKTCDQESGSCVYSAEVDRSRDVDDHRGTLCLVLLGAGEEWSTAKLTARMPSAMFIGEMHTVDWQALSLCISVE